MRLVGISEIKYLCNNLLNNILLLMKKILLLSVTMALSIAASAQKIEYTEAQTRAIEPMQDVFVRPMVADFEIIKEQRQTYGPTVFLQNLKLADMINSGRMDDILYQAKVLATYEAAKKENADVIVGATYLVTQATDAKGKVSEYGVSITVNGYPARYVRWHKLGEDTSDKDWVPFLLEGQRSRAYSPQERKAEAARGGGK